MPDPLPAPTFLDLRGRPYHRVASNLTQDGKNSSPATPCPSTLRPFPAPPQDGLTMAMVSPDWRAGGVVKFIETHPGYL